MAEFDDLGKAKKKIDGLLKLGEEIQKAAPYLVDINSNLVWYEKVFNAIPEQQDTILSNIEGALDNIAAWDYSQFEVYDASGTTASFYSASADTKNIIKSYKGQHYQLINDYNDINKTETIIERILVLLKDINSTLFSQFNEAKSTYFEWKVGYKTNSDLSKDIRTFQDTFKGFLNNLRLQKLPPKQEPEFSWPKMAEAIVRKGPGYLKSLKLQQNIHDNSHTEFTVIMKKTEIVTPDEMDNIFKNYIEHVFSVLNLIDQNIINQE